MSSHSLILSDQAQSPHNQFVAIIVCWFLGVFGVHRFMVGKWVTGLLMLFTGGGLGIWWIIDLVLLAMGRFRDAENRVLGPPRMQTRRLEAPKRPIPALPIHEDPEFDDAELMRDPLEDKFDQLKKDLRDGSL